MNHMEFASKTLIIYSIRRKIERIDLSSLPDNVFGDVLSALSSTGLCKEGGPFTGKYIMEKAKTTRLMSFLELIAPEYPRVKQLIAYFNSLQDGDIFRIVSEDAPTMNKQLAVLKTKGEEKGIKDTVMHNHYLSRWGLLTTAYRYYAFGYDGIRTAIGEGDRTNRICRFCGGRMPNVKYKEVAHAIPEGLGNKILFCNEECDDCNNKLSKLESNLTHYLDIRRAMGGILTKTDAKVPSVDGKGFVIRGDENNQAVLYLEREGLSANVDLNQSFQIKLETYETITHQGIFKSLCKMVIDVLPKDELNHFSETIGWINGSVFDDELPPYWASYDRESVKQPTLDIFLSNKPGSEPYCTAIAHILDVLFVFILPEVDVDKAQFKTVQSIEPHIRNFCVTLSGIWQIEDSSEYVLSNPWSWWTVNPGDPQVQIRPKNDPIFTRYRKEGDRKNEKEFPPFDVQGISDAIVLNATFKRHSLAPITIQELHQVSVNYNVMSCLLDKVTSKATFMFDINFSDSSNRLSYFDFCFEAEVNLSFFDKYIETSDYFCVDYHLRDYLCEIVMTAADVELNHYTAGTDLEPISLKKIINPRTIRQLYYQVPVGEGRYLIVKDAELHNL